MKSKDLVRIIYNKDTCYGMYDDRTPTDKELMEYFTILVEEYAMDFHKEQSIKDIEIEKKEEEQKIRWWNE